MLVTKDLPNTILYKPQNQKRMRQDDRVNTRDFKTEARYRYNERQIEKFIKWSIKNKGCLKYKDLLKIHDKYQIK